MPVCPCEIGGYCMKLIIYSSDVVGVQSNCIYPHRYEASDAASLADAVRRDHVCAEYQNHYRWKDNYHDFELCRDGCGQRPYRESGRVDHTGGAGGGVCGYQVRHYLQPAPHEAEGVVRPASPVPYLLRGRSGHRRRGYAQI